MHCKWAHSNMLFVIPYGITHNRAPTRTRSEPRENPFLQKNAKKPLTPQNRRASIRSNWASQPTDVQSAKLRRTCKRLFLRPKSVNGRCGLFDQGGAYGVTHTAAGCFVPGCERLRQPACRLCFTTECGGVDRRPTETKQP